MTPAQILLFLAVTASLTRRALCQEDGDDRDDGGEGGDEAVPPTETTETTPLPGTELPEPTESLDLSITDDEGLLPEGTTEEGSGSGSADYPMGIEEDPDFPNPVIIIIPLVLVLVIISTVVALVMICRRLKSKAPSPDIPHHDVYLDACEGEKVPMPMFEDDVPSVLELEMEDLEKWMVKDEKGDVPCHYCISTK
ncbi:transmembrane protein 154 isoform X2 [Engraulis encrasicolus]|uniref:transmembrane protein 154 isoform X2 n=1 Tax=Engraulis encrasicolus TaxID=184585 RepID=UPI002FD78E97